MSTEFRMFLAIIFRIGVNGSRVSASSPAPLYGLMVFPAALAGAAAAAFGAALAAAGAAAPLKLSMSALRTWPCLPLGWTSEISTPLSRAYWRTEGIAITSLFGSANGATPPWAGAASSFLSSAGAAVSSAPSSATGSSSSSSPSTLVLTPSLPSSINSKSSPFSTWSSSLTFRVLIVPSTGETSWVVDLSVWISINGSSALIWSPSLTNHEATSPSVSPSPISGSLNLYAISY